MGVNVRFMLLNGRIGKIITPSSCVVIFLQILISFRSSSKRSGGMIFLRLTSWYSAELIPTVQQEKNTEKHVSPALINIVLNCSTLLRHNQWPYLNTSVVFLMIGSVIAVQCAHKRKRLLGYIAKNRKSLQILNFFLTFLHFGVTCLHFNQKINRRAQTGK